MKKAIVVSSAAMLIISIAYLLYYLIFAPVPHDALRGALQNISSGDLEEAKKTLNFAIDSSRIFMLFNIGFIILVVIKLGSDLVLISRLKNSNKDRIDGSNG